MRRPLGPVVAIDGPAASGKSTTSRAVAKRLGACHLNSGLLYRAVAWCALRDGWIDAPAAWPEALARLDLGLERSHSGFVVTVSGERTGDELVSGAVTARVSEVAASAVVRQSIVPVLRRAGAEGGVVCDGRDIGTVVFPDAELKVYLVADAEERARRRLLERGERTDPDAVGAEARRLAERDRRDSERAEAPLRRAEDAIEVDTTGLAPEEVVDRIVTLAHKRSG